MNLESQYFKKLNGVLKVLATEVTYRITWEFVRNVVLGPTPHNLNKFSLTRSSKCFVCTLILKSVAVVHPLVLFVERKTSNSFFSVCLKLWGEWFVKMNPPIKTSMESFGVQGIRPKRSWPLRFARHELMRGYHRILKIPCLGFASIYETRFLNEGKESRWWILLLS